MFQFILLQAQDFISTDFNISDLTVSGLLLLALRTLWNEVKKKEEEIKELQKQARETEKEKLTMILEATAEAKELSFHVLSDEKRHAEIVEKQSKIISLMDKLEAILQTKIK